jgi:hypothetical protein
MLRGEPETSRSLPPRTGQISATKWRVCIERGRNDSRIRRISA